LADAAIATTKMRIIDIVRIICQAKGHKHNSEQTLAQLGVNECFLLSAMRVPLRTYGNYCAVDTSYTTSGCHFGGSFYPVAEKVGIFSILQASSEGSS